MAPLAADTLYAIAGDTGAGKTTAGERLLMVTLADPTIS
jgi:ABC-type glutathione transport system ATPase component